MRVVEWLGGPHDGTLFEVRPGTKAVQVSEEYTDPSSGVTTAYDYEVPVLSGKVLWSERSLVDTRAV